MIEIKKDKSPLNYVYSLCSFQIKEILNDVYNITIRKDWFFFFIPSLEKNWMMKMEEENYQNYAETCLMLL